MGSGAVPLGISQHTFRSSTQQTGTFTWFQALPTSSSAPTTNQPAATSSAVTSAAVTSAAVSSTVATMATMSGAPINQASSGFKLPGGIAYYWGIVILVVIVCVVAVIITVVVALVIRRNKQKTGVRGGMI
jgi:hypothetical protein